MVGILTKGAVILLAVVFVVVTLAMGAIFNDTWRENERYEKRATELRGQVSEAQIELENEQDRLRLLNEDPQYVERVIREELGYVKDGERVYRFETQP